MAEVTIADYVTPLVYVLTALAVAIILAIVFIPIAIAIKLDSPGPIFFIQTRYGRQGQAFQIRKFRSMVVNASELTTVPNDTPGKNQQDPRVTRVGRFLRRTTLDELPQLWNVLVGEMSLVGPRPPSEEELTYYGEQQWQQMTVKPGITSESLIVGYSAVKDWEQIVALDQRYQSQWHPLSDLVIFGKALIQVFARVFVSHSLDKQPQEAANAAKKNGM